jgi:hypothetical protein
VVDIAASDTRGTVSNPVFTETENRVTRRFFKTEKPVLGQFENRFFGFVFLAN